LPALSDLCVWCVSPVAWVCCAGAAWAGVQADPSREAANNRISPNTRIAGLRPARRMKNPPEQLLAGNAQTGFCVLLARLAATRQAAAQLTGRNSMKKTLIAGFAVLASTAAYAQSDKQMAVQQGGNTQTYNVPAGSKPQTVIITTRDLKDGESTA